MERIALKYGESLEDGSMRWVRRNDFAEQAKAIARRGKYEVLDAVFTNPGLSRLKKFDIAALSYNVRNLIIQAPYAGYTLKEIDEEFEKISNSLGYDFSYYKSITEEQYLMGKEFLKDLVHELGLMCTGFNGYKIYKVILRYNAPGRREEAESEFHSDRKHPHRNTISITRTVTGPSTIYERKGKNHLRLLVPHEALCAHAANGASHASPVAGYDYGADEPRLSIFIKLISNFPSKQ